MINHPALTYTNREKYFNFPNLPILLSSGHYFYYLFLSNSKTIPAIFLMISIIRQIKLSNLI